MAEVYQKFTTRGVKLDRTSSLAAIEKQELDCRLHEILLDATCLSNLFNTDPQSLRMEMDMFLEIIISVFSRLTHFDTLRSSKPQTPVLDAVYHIAITMFMMETFLQPDGRQILQFDPVVARFSEILSHGVDKLDSHLKLWLLLIGGIWAPNGTNESIVTSGLRDVTQQLGVKSWEDLRGAIQYFPWIKAIHEQRGCDLWNMATKFEYVS